MIEKGIFDSGKAMLFLGLLILFLPEVMSDEMAECFRLVGRVNTSLLVTTIQCEFGCCGSLEGRYCCTEEEKYGAQWRAWRMAGIVTGSVLAATFAIILVYCVCKKKNKMRMKVYNRPAFSEENPFSVVGTTAVGTTNMPSNPPVYQYLPASSEIRQHNVNNDIKANEKVDLPPSYSSLN